MESKKRTFVMERETKNCCVYQEQPPKGEAPIIGTLYVQKYLEPPKQITVTVEWAS